MSGLSVAMTTYNGEKFLREQLDSILNQTLSPDEILICDDHSTDTTFQILEEYAKKDTRIKIFRNENKLGFLKNFEKVLSLTKGEFIAPCDQDDIWVPDHLKILVESIGSSSVSVGEAFVFNDDSNNGSKPLGYYLGLDKVPQDNVLKSLFILLYQNPYQGASMLLRRDFLNKALPFPKGILYHDTWFAALACYLNGLNVIPEIITLYRRHENAVTGYKKRKSKFRRFLGHLLFSRYLKDRPPYIQGIKLVLSKNNSYKYQLEIIEKIEKFYNNRKTFIGRCKNLPFEIKYYKYIFGCS